MQNEPEKRTAFKPIESSSPMRQGQQGALPEHGALNSFDASASDVTNCDKAINGLKQMSMDKCTNSQAAQKEQKVALSDITSKYHKVDNRLPIRPLLSAKKNEYRRGP